MEHQLTPVASGIRAPDFTLPGCRSIIVSLRHLCGQPVVLVFVPAVSDPVSREQLTLYQEFLPELNALGAQIVAISTDSIDDLDAFAREAYVCFPLLSDLTPRGAVCRLYGIYREREAVTARALFVLDRSHTICLGRVYLDLLNPGVDDILTVLEGLCET